MATETTNPLVRDRDVEFLLYEMLDVLQLCRLPAFADHSRETFDLILQSTRRFAREKLFPSYKSVDEHGPTFDGDNVIVHPTIRALYTEMCDLGILTATRPESVGGQNVPLTVFSMATTYLMAANLSIYGYAGLTQGAAHLIEVFGTDWMRATLMAPLYDGRWTGTMALTEPHAGSSVPDLATRATPTEADHYLIRGAKIFISGGEHDVSENIVHLLLARIDGAPAGSKGVSLFAVPKLRPEDGGLTPNDVHATGLIHKIGWRGLPSLAMSYGDHNDCHGWLVGEPHRGLSCMFQMMNEARIMIGANGVATMSVAYHESVAYARQRTQGRSPVNRDPTAAQIPIIEHADVRRMLLRQKCMTEGGLALIATTSYFADLATHGPESERHRAKLLVDLLTPVAKSFPAERGFEANTLAVQVHGGYGYSSEYLPEAWLRDQKLNSIHEGTTGIQSMDLLGRKVVADGGKAVAALAEEIKNAVQRARGEGVTPRWCDALLTSIDLVGTTTQTLAMRGAAGDVEAMLRHSVDYLDLFSTVVVGWQWLEQARAARRAIGRRVADGDFYRGKLRATQYWFATEMPRVTMLADRCVTGDDSYAGTDAAWF